MLQGFLEQVVKSLDLFVESQDDTSAIQGDRMPSTTYCTGLNGKPPDHFESDSALAGMKDICCNTLIPFSCSASLGTQYKGGRHRHGQHG